MRTTEIASPSGTRTRAGRRQHRSSLPALAVSAALLLAACGGGPSELATPAPEPPSDTASASAEAFPVTIEHVYGETEIATEPERIVTVGLNDMDAVFALGKAPMASNTWFTGEVVHPWSEEAAAAASTAETQILSTTYEVNFEAIAAADPDLITAIFFELSEQDYQTLSRIAPVIAWPAEFDAYETPWQEQVRQIGRALASSERADELVAEVESAYAAAAERHPEWDGASAVLTSQYTDGELLVYPGNTPATSILELLGFVIPNEFSGDDLFDETYSVAALSAEQLELIDRDLIVSDADLDSLESSGYLALPTYQSLDAVQEGRVLYPPEDVVDGLSFRTVLSMPWILEKLEDPIAAAFDGATP